MVIIRAINKLERRGSGSGIPALGLEVWNEGERDDDGGVPDFYSLGCGCVQGGCCDLAVS